MDGLRADHSSVGGYKRDTTPTLSVLASLGVNFSLSFSQSNESLLSHASMFTGRYTSEIAWPEFLEFTVPDEATTLAEIAQAMGYQTAGFVGGGHIRARFGFQQGFTVYAESPRAFGSFFETVPLALSWLDDTRDEETPFFMFLHGYDCHRPYLQRGLFSHPFQSGDNRGDWALEQLIRVHSYTDHVYKDTVYSDFTLETVWHANGAELLPATVYERLAEHAAGEHAPGSTYKLSAGDMAHVVAHYDSGVLSADTYVGLFLEGLADRGLWENTLVIVTADHGEDLLDHGFYNHRPVLFDSTTRVPLILTGGYVPKEWHGRELGLLTQAIDIAPTVATVLGTVRPAGARGRDLWTLLKEPQKPAPPDQAIFQEGVMGQVSVRTHQWRLVFEGKQLTRPDYTTLLAETPLTDPTFALYDVGNDPREQVNVALENLPVAQQLRADLLGWWSGLDRGTARMALDEETIRQLQEKGYW
jgi:arylsulfatase A-like enzyme